MLAGLSRNRYLFHVSGTLPGTGEKSMTMKKWGMFSTVLSGIFIVLCVAPAICGGAPAGAIVTVAGSGSGQDLVGWQSGNIDGTGAYSQFSSIAVGRTGPPQIATIIERAEFESSLVYFTREGGVWKEEVVDDQSVVTGVPQITTDQFGQPHIIYAYLINGVTADYALKYAHKDRFGWHIENLTDTLGQTFADVSIAVNIQGSPRIVYLAYPHGSLRYASRDGTSWQTEEIDPDPSAWPVLRLDRNGEPRVLYTERPNFFTREKRFASRERGEWDIDVLDQNLSGQFYNLELDLLGSPHIAFSRVGPDIPNEEVVYITRDRTGWHEEPVVQGDLLQYADLAVSDNGVVGVSYAPINSFDEVTSIQYAVKSRSGWSPETVATKDESTMLSPGMGMASGSGGKVYLTASREAFTENGREVTPFLSTRELRVPGFG
jgi:hypothetical protein